jgi:cell division protein FtsX
MGEVRRYNGVKDERRERRMHMWEGIVLGVMGALFSVAVSHYVAQSVKEVLAWHRNTGQAAVRANIAAAEIQRMLSGRTRPLISRQR